MEELTMPFKCTISCRNGLFMCIIPHQTAQYSERRTWNQLAM